MRFPYRSGALLDKIICGWVTAVIRHPCWFVSIILLLTIAGGYYTFHHLGVNTDTTGMLSPELPFKKDHNFLNRVFPDDARAILVVVRGTTPELTHAAVKDLGERFRQAIGIVESVYTPNQEPFFERQALLYQDTDQLDKIALDIMRAQPLLARLALNNTLEELLNLLTQALLREDIASRLKLDLVLDELSNSVQAAIEGRDYTISWQNLMLGQNSELNDSTEIILVRPHFNYTDFIPAKRSFNVIRSISRDFEMHNPGISVRMTGEVALEHEELKSVSQGTEIASLVSLVLVSLTLLWGLRSVKLVGVTMISLIVGLVLSGAFAALWIGHLNLISIAFSVLYIGLGVDYAIHLSLHFEDLVNSKKSPCRAVLESVRCVGPSIVLCAVTTAIGFYAFVPTAYEGVSELGIIAGTAMFIGLFVTLTLIPAMFVILPCRRKRFKATLNRLPSAFYEFPVRYARGVKVGTFFLVIGGAFSLSDVTFDFDPIALRDQRSESVITFRDLLKRKETSPLVISVLAYDRSDAIRRSARLDKLNSVDKVVSILDFIPEDQPEKLQIIHDLDDSLGRVLMDFQAPGEVDVGRQTLAIENLIETLDRNRAELPVSGEGRSIRMRLLDDLEQLRQTLDRADPEHKEILLARIQHSMLGNLALTMDRLRLALTASEFDNITDLPDSFVRRWLSPEGIFRLLVFPEKDLNHLDNLKEFVADVQKVEPRASDLPVFYAESGKAVVEAFQQALSYAILAVLLVSFLVLRNLKETVLVLLPLLLAAILTGATTVLFDNPFNFANIIVLPLLLGLGIDNSIHVVHRVRILRGRRQEILRTSTARGVFFSGLTTVCSFTSLTMISHAGTASLGFLLTAGILLSLFCSLVVLPAFMVGESNV